MCSLVSKEGNPKGKEIKNICCFAHSINAVTTEESKYGWPAKAHHPTFTSGPTMSTLKEHFGIPPTAQDRHQLNIQQTMR